LALGAEFDNSAPLRFGKIPPIDHTRAGLPMAIIFSSIIVDVKDLQILRRQCLD